MITTNCQQPGSQLRCTRSIPEHAPCLLAPGRAGETASMRSLLRDLAEGRRMLPTHRALPALAHCSPAALRDVLRISGTYVESVSFSFLRIPKAFLVRFFNPADRRSTNKNAN